MLMIIGILFQSIIFLFVFYVYMRIGFMIFNTLRNILYRLGWDWFTNEEKIRFGIVQSNIIEPEVVDSYPENLTSEERWEALNARLDKVDMEWQQSHDDPDEILFRGRLKRRR